MLAPNAPLRAAAIAFGREVADATGSPTAVSSPPRAQASNARSPARYLWAMLLTRLFEPLPLVCPNCGADMRIIAFITEAAPVEQILTRIGEPPRPTPISSARGPPAWDEEPEPMPDRSLLQQPEPDFELDQRVSWSPPSPAGDGAAPFVSRWRAAPQMRAPALRNAPAFAAPKVRQRRR